MAKLVSLKSEETGEQHKLKLHDLQPDGTGRLDWAAAKEAFGADLLEIKVEGTPGLLQEGDRKGLTRDTYKPGENILVMIGRRAQAAPNHALMEQALRTVADQQTTLEDIKKIIEERHNTLYQDLLQMKQNMGGTLARRRKSRGAQPGKYRSTLPPVIEADL